MAKPEWGNKRQCQSCNAKFYDLQRNPIVCPKCNSVFELDDEVQEEEVVATKVEAEKDVESEVGVIDSDVNPDEDDVTVLASDDEDDDPAGDDSTTVRLSDEEEET